LLCFFLHCWLIYHLLDTDPHSECGSGSRSRKPVECGSGFEKLVKKITGTGIKYCTGIIALDLSYFLFKNNRKWDILVLSYKWHMWKGLPVTDAATVVLLLGSWHCPHSCHASCRTEPRGTSSCPGTCSAPVISYSMLNEFRSVPVRKKMTMYLYVRKEIIKFCSTTVTGGAS
jgi:hypothetical protein